MNRGITTIKTGSCPAQRQFRTEYTVLDTNLNREARRNVKKLVYRRDAKSAEEGVTIRF